ncbi:hypothetical protein [Phyllobacterium sp. K27]
MMIVVPKRNGPYPEREIDCQMAVEDAVLAIVEGAHLAGWGKAEVLAAIIDVADNTSLALDVSVAQSINIHLSKLMKKPDV